MDVSVPVGHVGAHLLTLEAGTVVHVRFAEDLDAVEVMSDGGADIWWTVDGTDPVAAGSRCFRIPVGVLGTDGRQPPSSAHTVVSLVSSGGTAVVSVQRAAP